MKIVHIGIFTQYLEHNLLLLVIAASDLSLRTIKFYSFVISVALKLLVINTSSRPQE